MFVDLPVAIAQHGETRGDAPAASSPYLVLIADDLMMPSRIREGCRPLGYEVRVAATSDAAFALLAESEATPPVAVLVNLTARRYDPNPLIRAIKSDTRFFAVPLLAFAGHVEKGKHDAARVAGADMVAANSSVSLHLPILLSRLLSSDALLDGTASVETEGSGDEA